MSCRRWRSGRRRIWKKPQRIWSLWKRRDCGMNTSHYRNSLNQRSSHKLENALVIGRLQLAVGGSEFNRTANGQLPTANSKGYFPNLFATSAQFTTFQNAVI